MSETQCICLSAILETHDICINEKTLISKYQGLLGMGKNIDLLLRCYVCGAVKFTIMEKSCQQVLLWVYLLHDKRAVMIL